MKRLAIFDFDGTLFDSIEDVLICFNRVLAEHGLPTMTRDGLIPCLGGNIDEIVSLVLGKNYSDENLEIIKKTYLNCYNSSKKEKTIPFPDSEKLLVKLQEKNVILAVNSNRLNYSLNEFIDRYFNEIDFISIEGNDPELPSKPHPYGVNEILKKADVKPDEAIYIGDSKTDILTAKNAGIDCLIVNWGYGLEKDMDDDYILGIVESPCEILKYF